MRRMHAALIGLAAGAVPAFGQAPVPAEAAVTTVLPSASPTCTAPGGCGRAGCTRCDGIRNPVRGNVRDRFDQALFGPYGRGPCMPTISSGSCYGFYQSNWTKWADACPGWNMGGLPPDPVVVTTMPRVIEKKPSEPVQPNITPAPAPQRKTEEIPKPRSTKPPQDMGRALPNVPAIPKPAAIAVPQPKPITPPAATTRPTGASSPVPEVSITPAPAVPELIMSIGSR